MKPDWPHTWVNQWIYKNYKINFVTKYWIKRSSFFDLKILLKNDIPNIKAQFKSLEFLSLYQ